jgi:hypothetical protein
MRVYRLGARARESIQPRAGGIHGGDLGEIVEWHSEAPGVGDLRHECDVGL